MKSITIALLGVFGAWVADCQANAQQPRPAPVRPCIKCAAAPAGAPNSDEKTTFHWAAGCFPRCNCPDDYCPTPLPRQCSPTYPPFYRCVAAGCCYHPPVTGVGNERLTWWWIPTPRALREALLWRP